MTWKEVQKSDGMQWAMFLRLLEAPGSLCAAGAHVSLLPCEGTQGCGPHDLGHLMGCWIWKNLLKEKEIEFRLKK